VRIFKVAGLASALALGLVAFPPLSKAAVYNFFANACSSGLGCSGSPSSLLATATTSTLGSNVLVDLHIVDPNFFFIQAGNPPMMGWNSPTPTLASSPTQNPGGPVTWSQNGAFNSGGPGDFTQSLGFLDKSNTIWNSDIIFQLGGVTLSQFITNSAGFFFAVDLCNAPGGTNGGTCTTRAGAPGGTGFVGAVLAQTPLPPAALLFASALVGLGILGRRRRKHGLTAA